jgi:hypothetical protein
MVVLKSLPFFIMRKTLGGIFAGVIILNLLATGALNININLTVKTLITMVKRLPELVVTEQEPPKKRTPITKKQ